MKPELHDKKNKLEEFDLLVIKDRLNLVNKMERVLSMTTSYVYTKNYKFLRSTLECVNAGNETLYIDDIIYNLRSKTLKFLTDKGWNTALLVPESIVVDITINNTYIELSLSKVETPQQLEIHVEVNNHTMYLGEVRELSELKTILESIFRRLKFKL